MPKKIVNAALESRVNTVVSRHAKKAPVARHVSDDGAEKKSWYHFVNRDAEADLFIYDEISGFWGISANDFARDLAEIDAKTLNLYINSPGGSVFEGYAIYSMLVRHAEKKNVTIKVIVDGWAASIASVIAMAGDHISVGAHASIMIHKPWSIAFGNADEMRDEADVLDQIEDGIIDIYVARTGGDREEITDWVDAETWFKGQAAVDAGFADEVVELKKKPDTENKVKAQPAASADVSYFDTIFPNMPNDVRESLSAQSADGKTKSRPTTKREFAARLREDYGFSRDAADSIAAHGFRPKDDPRDGASESENPTTTDPRDGAEERDETAKAIRDFANAMAIKAAASKLNLK